MQKLKESRHYEIDVERCAKNAGGRYELILNGARRLREMRKQVRNANQILTTIDVLLEYQNASNK
jgi:hypothetical protein